MKRALLALITISAGLSACESHNNHAPLVYNMGANGQARIYNSPDDIYRKQQAAQQRAYQQQQMRPAPTVAVASSDMEPVTLTPVSEIRLSSDPAPRQATAETQKVKGYIEVQPGDTVYAIGRRYNVTPQSIIAANNLRPPYLLDVGQALKLPKGASIAAAPTNNMMGRKVVARDTLYAVRQGDTLYSISRASKVPVETIARANRLASPYALSVGQQLLIPQAPVDSAMYASASQSQSQSRSSQPASQKIANDAPQDVGDLARNVSYTRPEPARPKTMFDWPVKGAIIASYGSGEIGRRNDGVNIAAPAGTPVRAAADGEVVYRGAELDGFGNLLLIKHVDGFVTAYAHNDAMLVKKGDKVRQGQIIAKVGETGAVSSPQLHFEIRQNLKSVDPVALLGAQ